MFCSRLLARLYAHLRHGRLLVLVLWGTVCCYPSVLSAQTPQSEATDIITRIVEEYWLSADEAFAEDAEEAIEQLQYLRQHPLDLNTADRASLDRLFFLSPEQADAIWQYLSGHRPLRGLSELAALPEVDAETYRRLRPFIVASAPSVPKGTARLTVKPLSQQWRVRVGLPRYAPSAKKQEMLGADVYAAARYTGSHSKGFSWGVVAESDRGEPFFKSPNRYGFDHYALHFSWQGTGVLRQLVLGHYKLSLGHGLLLNNRLLFTNSMQSFAGDARRNRLSGYVGTDEWNILQGAAAVLSPWRGGTLTLFTSVRAIDARLQNDSLRTIYRTGLHRTPTEVSHLRSTSLQQHGLRLMQAGTHFSAGVNVLYTAFGAPLSHMASPTLQGLSQRSLQLSTDYEWRIGSNSLFSGELSTDLRGLAALHRLHLFLPLRTRFQMLHRYYSPRHHSFAGKAFGRSATPTDEHGLFLALENNYLSRHTLFLSADVAHHARPTARVSLPATEYRLFSRLTSRFTPHLTSGLSYQLRLGWRNRPGTQGREVLPYALHRLRLEIDATPRTSVLCRTTAEGAIMDVGYLTAQPGLRLTQLLRYQHPRGRWQGTLQATGYSVPHHDARLYLAEPALPGTLQMQMLTGRGFCWAGMLSLQLCPGWLLHAQISHHLPFRSGGGSAPAGARPSLTAQVQTSFTL